MDSNEKSNTIIINCEKITKKKHVRKRPNKRERMNNTSAEKKGTSQQTDISIAKGDISQQINIEKQAFQCIINLNTTVCKHKSKHRKCDKKRRSKHLDSHHDEEPKSKCSVPNSMNVNENDKIVPKCFRQACLKHTPHDTTIERSYVKYRHKDRNKATCRKDEEKQEIQQKSKHGHHKCRHSRHENKRNEHILLSPISSSPLKDDVDKLSYEDISTESLEIDDIEKPAPHKHVKHRKHCKHIHRKLKEEVHESKLDTLIRRTKERERKLVEQSRVQPRYTSTPIQHEFSSGDPISNSDMDISFNSRSTLVLDTRNYFAYSPTCPIEDMHASSETEKLSYHAYSPSSPNEDYKFEDLEIPGNNDYKVVNIKNEPMMEIEAYSPIRSPDDFTPKTNDCFTQNTVKYEVVTKTEPLLSPKLSPTYFENNICMLESIKSEKVEGDYHV